MITIHQAQNAYMNDCEFHALVDMIHNFIASGRYTPSELRAAVILAATHYEIRNIRPVPVFSQEYLAKPWQEAQK